MGPSLESKAGRIGSSGEVRVLPLLAIDSRNPAETAAGPSSMCVPLAPEPLSLRPARPPWSAGATPPRRASPERPRPPWRARRIVSLDVARGLGVLAMVMGHTLDAVLAPAARAQPAVEAYWRLRGLTAPLFLVVAGWAFTVSASRAPERVPRRLLRRSLLLLLVACALRLPGWDWGGFLRGDLEAWRGFLAFDALHVIGLGLLLLLGLRALPLRGLARGAVLLLLAAGWAGVATSLPHLEPHRLPALALAQALGGTSAFPLFPWVAYLLAGAAIPLLTGGARSRGVSLCAAGAALLLGAHLHGMERLPPQHAALLAHRLGMVLLLLALLEAAPAALSSALAPLSRSSLPIYAVHVGLVYGWLEMPGLATRIGPRLSLPQALCAGLAVLAVAAVVSKLLERDGREDRARARHVPSRLAPSGSLV